MGLVLPLILSLTYQCLMALTHMLTFAPTASISLSVFVTAIDGTTE